MPDRRVFDLRIARLQRAHDHLAGVHAHTNFYGYSATLEESVAVTTNFLLHTERRVQCALRMVFVGYRSSEDREDAIPGVLYIAVVAPRGVDHYFQRRVDDRARL